MQSGWQPALNWFQVIWCEMNYWACRCRWPGNACRIDYLQLKKMISLGSWNVRFILQAGKLYVVERSYIGERDSNMWIIWSSWKYCGHFTTIDHTVYISSDEQSGHNRVVFVVNKQMTKFVEIYESINNCILKKTIYSKLVRFYMLQDYLPTSVATDYGVDIVYKQDWECYP